jgi:hypothetical protein
MNHDGIESVELYIKLFVYISIFSATVLVTTIVLHEGGHYLAGTMLANCEGTIIFFDKESFGPYTKLDCPVGPDVSFLYLTSFLLVIPFALCFLILRGFPEIHFFLMVMGAAIFTAAIDIQNLTGSELAHTTSLLTGLIIYLTGQYFLTDRTFMRFKEKLYTGRRIW